MFNLKDYIPEEQLNKICAKYRIRKLSLFGSTLRGDMNDKSDIDILVEFNKGETPGLITFCGIQNELTELMGRQVDLRTPNDLSRYFRDDVLNYAEVIYVH